jgi:hypothetical protein
MVSTKGGVAIVGEWGSVSQDDLASRVHHAQFYARECINHGMVAVWWDDGAGFHILNRGALSWQYPTIAQALADGAKQGVFPTVGTLPSNENKISLNNGLLVKAGVVNYTLPKATSVSLNLYNMQGKIVFNLVQSNQPAGNHEVKLPTKGISFGNYILEFKAGNNFTTKKINIL